MNFDKEAKSDIKKMGKGGGGGGGGAGGGGGRAGGRRAVKQKQYARLCQMR